MSIKNFLARINSFYSGAVLLTGIMSGVFLLKPQLIRQRYRWSNEVN
jgi:hypothetical protein